MKFRWLALVVILSVGLAACSLTLAEDITPPPGYLSPTPPPTTGPLYPPAPPSPQRGAPIYVQECQPCHGEKGLGNGPLAGKMPVAVPAISLRQVASQFAPADWYTVVSQGNLSQGMPPFTSLSAQQRWDVLAYAYSLGTTGDQLQHGAALYTERCTACHGAGGRGDGPQAASLSPAPKDFTDRQYMSLATDTGLYRSIAEGAPPGMAAFGNQLSADDIWALVAYLRSLTFDLSAPVAMALPSSTLLPPTGTVPPAGTPPAPTPGQAAATAATPGGTPAETPVAGTGLTTTPTAIMIVRGQVTASGGTLPGGLSATLHGFTSQQETVTRSTSLGPDGAYEFTDPPLTDGMQFYVTVKYETVEFASAGATYDGKTTSFDQPVTVYETTADTGKLSLDQFHTIVDFSTAGSVQFYEIYVITNPGSSAVVVPSDGHSLPFIRVPENAVQPSLRPVQGSAALLSADGGFAFPPGPQQYALVSFFSMPYNGKIDLTQPFVLPVAYAIVLVPEGVTVRSSQLTDGGTQTIQGATYRQYNASALAAGQSLSMTISGTPQTASTSTAASRPLSLMIGMGAFGVVLIAAGVYLFLRDRARKDEEGVEEGDETEDDEDALGNDPERITDAIIVLDEQFKAGELNKGAYEKRRAALKERLRKALG